MTWNKLNCEVIQAQNSHMQGPTSHFYVLCVNLEHKWKQGSYKGAFGRLADYQRRIIDWR